MSTFIDARGINNAGKASTEVCSTCKDTHRMEFGDQKVMCTHCPSPCEKCRKNGNGAFCEKTPCDCQCHKKSKKAKQEGVLVNSRFLYHLMVCAARYCWERSSYAVDDMSDCICQYANELTEDQRDVIIKDIEKSQKEWEISGHQYNCDGKSMKKALDYLLSLKEEEKE